MKLYIKVKHRKQRSDKGKSRKSYKRKNTGSSNGRIADFESTHESSILSPVAKPAPEISQSKSDGDFVLGSAKLLNIIENVINTTGELTFEDLPQDRQDKVLHEIEMRKLKKLSDDSEDRKQQAVNYYKFEIRSRK